MYQNLRLLNPMYRSIFHKKLFHKSVSDSFKFSDEVAESILKGSPIVALESTVITHGLPYPENLSTACKLEETVRRNRATPATIGIIKGNIHIGMTSKELQMLAESKSTIKVSRRDLPYILSKGLSGGTTVAATMALAHRAGISIFATGGIGGVHRGAENTMDISADLYELARTPMTVISAGVKSILDIGRTLEYLETLGVCVATFGASKEFPSFFTPRSKFSAACNAETVLDAARLIDARDHLELESGILLAVPIPSEFHEDGYRTEAVIEEALEEARKKNITGKDITPYVLNKVRELSKGASLRANIGLLENNANVGSQIAVQLNEIKKQSNGRSQSSRGGMSVQNETKEDLSIGRPVVIGGSILDIHVKALEQIKMDGRTVKGKVESIAGGVGRNVADCLSRLQLNPLLISTAGALEHASPLLNKMDHMDKSGITIVPDARTATCLVVLDEKGECIFMIGDMNVHDLFSKDQIRVHQDAISAAPLVILDGNTPPNTMKYIFNICSKNRIPVWFEPTDISRAFRPFNNIDRSTLPISYASPNLKELRVMHDTIMGSSCVLSTEPESPLENILDECLELGSVLLRHHLHTLVITLGSHGVFLITNLPPETPFPLAPTEILEDGNIFDSQKQLRAVHYPALKPKQITSVSGAGDCFAAGMIASMLKGASQHQCILAGQQAALLSLASHHAVPDTIIPEVVSPKEWDPVISHTVIV